MSRQSLINQKPHTLKLEKLANRKYLYEGLKLRYSPKNEALDNKLHEKIDRYDEIIAFYHETITDIENKRKIKKIKIPNSPQDLAKPVNPESKFKKIADKASIYFQQGLELYLSSMNMNINSAPLVEYYGFLQCVKGAVLLDFEIKDFRLFSQHGLTIKRGRSNRNLRAKVMTFGVFQALLLLQSSEPEIENFLHRRYYLTLESLLEEKLLKNVKNSQDSNEIRNPMDYAPPVFIASWILSSLVRYFPILWQKIYFGLDDMLILRIGEYREKNIPEAIDSILPVFPLRIRSE